MSTESITKNFIVSGKKQIEKFANAIEESYQESLTRKKDSSLRITHLRDASEVKKFLEQRSFKNQRNKKIFGDISLNRDRLSRKLMN